MRKAYLLAFSDDLGTRDQVKECLEKMSSVILWRYDMTNAFYIISESAANTIANELMQYITNGGRFIVTEISDNKEGWLTEESWYIMNHKSYMPKTS